MIHARKIRELTLAAPVQADRGAYLSSASGLVRVGRFLYVVADDEVHLGVFEEGSLAPGTTFRVLEGELPPEKKARKKKKPDFEALVMIPASFHPPHGALLLVPSGSKAHRGKGALVSLDGSGQIAGEPRHVDFSPFFSFLGKHFDPLNIEAAAVCGDELRLLNRGNKKDQPNALLVLDLPLVLPCLLSGKSLASKALRTNREVDLGKRAGTRFTFTDATALGEKLLFTAVAEATEDSYEDGPCHGSAVGLLDEEGRVIFFDEITPSHKVEGITASTDSGKISCLMVNDEDDPKCPSSLLAAELVSP